MKRIKPMISIIVPIYKVENYLERCIESLTNQTYKNIEIILVDDGSPDNCPKICDDYADKDHRVKVIHKLNGGLSDARNRGLEEAISEYILFVDSDDYIELNACEQFVEIIKKQKADIIVGNAKRIEKNKISLMGHRYITTNKIITGPEFLKKELSTNSMHMAAWLNLYNKDFLLKNKLKFKVGILHEDIEFTPRVFLKAKTIIGTNIVFYNYLIRDGSITTQKNKTKNAEHIMAICKELDKIYIGIDDKELKKLLDNSLVDMFLNTFQVAGLHKKKYAYLVDKKFLKGKSYTKRNKFRVILIYFNKSIYYHVNKISKILLK